MTGCADPGSAMHADADVPLRPDAWLAGVQAHPDLHLATFWPVVCGETTLSIDCGGHRVGGGSERNEERIALRVHHPPRMRQERCPEDLLMRGQELFVAVLTKPLQQPRRA